MKGDGGEGKVIINYLWKCGSGAQIIKVGLGGWDEDSSPLSLQRTDVWVSWSFRWLTWRISAPWGFQGEGALWGHRMKKLEKGACLRSSRARRRVEVYIPEGIKSLTLWAGYDIVLFDLTGFWNAGSSRIDFTLFLKLEHAFIMKDIKILAG